MQNFYLAIDIGASSGRHILGWQENGHLKTREVYRFPNGAVHSGGHLIWDLPVLVQHVEAGIKAAFSQAPGIRTVSIDTWAVDYVLLRNDEELYPCYAYRDERTAAVIPRVHERVPFDELYCRTGCQFQSFNTIYQLYDDLQTGRLSQATDLLMLPEYLLWKLTGIKSREYTNATSTGLVNGDTGTYDDILLQALGYPKELFPALSQPGTVLGPLKPEVAARVGGNCTAVLCATHDTASAVEGIPMEENIPYISSGTWSLLGLKVPAPIRDDVSRQANFTNEGGVGYIRYQKNIMGMWLINRLKDEICPDIPFAELTLAAQQSSYNALVDANAAAFLAPASMKQAFDEALAKHLPATDADYFRCACRSLAACYASALRELEANTKTTCDSICIVGGGANNQFINACTAEFTGKKIIALPVEASALGNLKLQMRTTADI